LATSNAAAKDCEDVAVTLTTLTGAVVLFVTAANDPALAASVPGVAIGTNPLGTRLRLGTTGKGVFFVALAPTPDVPEVEPFVEPPFELLELDPEVVVLLEDVAPEVVVPLPDDVEPFVFVFELLPDDVPEDELVPDPSANGVVTVPLANVPGAAPDSVPVEPLEPADTVPATATVVALM
jgi:hypothetical protein